MYTILLTFLLPNLQKEMNQMTSKRSNDLLVSVGQVEPKPEILLIYRANLVLTAHKISAPDTLHKGAAKLLEVGMYNSNLCHHARVCRQSAKQQCGIPQCIPTEYKGQALRGCERLEKSHTNIYIA
jgi:hypothetical protein